MKFISQCLSGKDREGIVAFHTLMSDLNSYLSGGHVASYQGSSTPASKRQFDNNVQSHIDGNTMRIPKAHGGSRGMGGVKSDSFIALPWRLMRIFSKLGKSLIKEEAAFNKHAPKHPEGFEPSKVPVYTTIMHKVMRLVTQQSQPQQTTKAIKVIDKPQAPVESTAGKTDALDEIQSKAPPRTPRPGSAA